MNLTSSMVLEGIFLTCKADHRTIDDQTPGQHPGKLQGSNFYF